MTDENVNPTSAASTQESRNTMADLLSEHEYTFKQPQRGDVRTGTVVWIGPNEIVVDIGVKREGVISARDLERLSAEEVADISVGTEVPVYVVKPEDQDGNLVASIYLARLEMAWQEAQEYLESGDIVESEVTGYNKGGLIVPFGVLRGFVPASHVVGVPRRLSESERLERLAQQVGREVVVQVIEVDRKRKRLVMSEQAAQREWREHQRRQLMDTLAEGQVVHGVVRSVVNFGAFVDLGGVDGLVHISELSWQPVKHPSQVVQVGDELDVFVLNLDKNKGKIGLSLKRLQPDPWSLVDSKYVVGERVEGAITNIVDFGAFVRLDEGIEGLVHVSELSEEEVGHPAEIVKQGEPYLLEIIRIDPARRRIGLSLKRVSPEEQAIWNASRVASIDEVGWESASSHADEAEPRDLIVEDREEAAEIILSEEVSDVAEDVQPVQPEPEMESLLMSIDEEPTSPTDEFPNNAPELEGESADFSPQVPEETQNDEHDAWELESAPSKAENE